MLTIDDIDQSVYFGEFISESENKGGFTTKRMFIGHAQDRIILQRREDIEERNNRALTYITDGLFTSFGGEITGIGWHHCFTHFHSILRRPRRKTSFLLTTLRVHFVVTSNQLSRTTRQFNLLLDTLSRATKTCLHRWTDTRWVGASSLLDKYVHTSEDVYRSWLISSVFNWQK